MSDLAGMTNGDLVTMQVFVDGSALPDEYMVDHIDVIHELNRIPRATVAIVDGDPARDTFPASEDRRFTPGGSLRIELGHNGKNDVVFDGIIQRHSIRVREADADKGLLLLGCSDQALALTVARTSRTFVNSTDSDMLTQIISDAGLAPNVESTSPVHEHIVQSQASDWDYVVARAEASGRVVKTSGGTVNVIKPQFDQPDLRVAFGENLLGMDLEIDAASQLESVTALGWNTAEQETTRGESSEPSVNKQGNLTGRALSKALGVEDFELQTPRELGPDELATWADAQLLKSRLARIRGTLTFPGAASIEPGMLLKLEGAGKRFDGNAYVSGVRHHVSAGAWTTIASCGLDQPWSTELDRRISAPAAAGLSPGVSGMQIAKVVDLADPEGAGRIKVRLPFTSPDAGIWVRMAIPYASDGAGIAFYPEIDDEVLVGFLNDDPNAPVVLGALHSKSSPSPITPDTPNNTKAIVTREKLTIEFDEDHKAITISTPGGHIVALDDSEQTVSITDLSGNKITMGADGIDITTPGDLSISAGGKITLEGGAIELKSDSELSAEGSASASLSSSGTTTVTGSIVQIN